MSENASQQTFESWCIVEMMGHQRMAGLVTEQNIAGHGFLRIDVHDPETEAVLFTRFVSPGSIYAINPVDKKIALEMGRSSTKPVTRYEMSNLLPASRPEPRDYDDTYEDDEEPFRRESRFA